MKKMKYSYLKRVTQSNMQSMPVVHFSSDTIDQRVDLKLKDEKPSLSTELLFGPFKYSQMWTSQDYSFFMQY